jgi:serine/threonine protein phosphatase PrpC
MKDRAALNLVEPISARQDLYDWVIVVSPGKEDGEYKAQDRASAHIIEDGARKKQMAIVCDGLSQSPNSAEAAEYVSDNLNRLYEEDGLGAVATGLLEKRAAFVNMPLRLDDMDSPVLKGMFEEIVRDKRATSHQTTFIAACLEMSCRSAPDRIGVRILGCGDSAAFIFTAGGKLLYNNLGLRDEHDPLVHLSPITEALPDSYDERASRILAHALACQEGMQVLLCSDGLYDTFATFAEIFQWLNENSAALRQERKEEAMRDLHSRLSSKKGDDDISFVWLFSREGVESAPAPEVFESAGPQEEEGRASGETQIKVTLWQRIKKLLFKALPWRRPKNILS